jgi:putative copper export protein
MSLDILSVTLRALAFVALFQAAGIVIFLALLEQRLPRTEPLLRRLGALFAIAAVVLLTAQFVLEPARMSGELAGPLDPALQRLVLHSATAVTFTWRMLGLLLILFALHRRGPEGVTLGVAGVAVLLAAFTFIGHTSKDPQRWLLSPLLLAHLALVAFWFGALPPLYLISAREPAELSGTIVQQFSRRAVWLVPALAVAGVAIATVLLPDLRALRTPYGALLLVKAAGFSVLMVLAALNKWRFAPALQRGEVVTARRFRYSLAAEYGLIVIVLCVTAVMTSFYSPEV